MTRPWKLKTNSSNILLVLITLIHVNGDSVDSLRQSGTEDGSRTALEGPTDGDVRMIVGNDKIAEYYFRPGYTTGNDTQNVLDHVNRCLDNFQLVTCLKMYLLYQLDGLIDRLESPDLAKTDLHFMNGMVSFKRRDDGSAEVVDDDDNDYDLDDEIAYKVRKMFQNRTLRVHLFSHYKIDISPVSGDTPKGYVRFKYRIMKEPEVKDDGNRRIGGVAGSGTVDGTSDAWQGRKKKKSDGMSMMMMLPQMMMLGFMPFTIASLKAMVMNAVMVNMMALNGAIFMTIRNYVFGPRSGGNVQYVNYGYSKDRQTQRRRPALIIHSPAAFVKQPPYHHHQHQHHHHYHKPSHPPKFSSHFSSGPHFSSPSSSSLIHSESSPHVVASHPPSSSFLSSEKFSPSRPGKLTSSSSSSSSSPWAPPGKSSRPAKVKVSSHKRPPVSTWKQAESTSPSVLPLYPPLSAADTSSHSSALPTRSRPQPSSFWLESDSSEVVPYSSSSSSTTFKHSQSLSQRPQPSSLVISDPSDAQLIPSTSFSSFSSSSTRQPSSYLSFGHSPSPVTTNSGPITFEQSLSPSPHEILPPTPWSQEYADLNGVPDPGDDVNVSEPIVWDSQEIDDDQFVPSEIDGNDLDPSSRPNPFRRSGTKGPKVHSDHVKLMQFLRRTPSQGQSLQYGDEVFGGVNRRYLKVSDDGPTVRSAQTTNSDQRTKVLLALKKRLMRRGPS